MFGISPYGDSGISGRLVRFSFVNTLSYCSRSASAFDVSSVQARLFQNNVGKLVDSQRRSFRYDHVLLTPVLLALSLFEVVAIPHMTASTNLAWVSPMHFVVLFRMRLYAIWCFAFPVRLALLCARSCLFIIRLISGLTQGRWRFAFVILDERNWSVAVLIVSEMRAQFSSTDRFPGHEPRYSSAKEAMRVRRPS